MHDIVPIRVLFVDHTAKLGGGEIALRNLARHLDSQLIRMEFLFCAEGPLVDQLRTAFPVCVMPLSEQIADTRKSEIGWRSCFKIRYLFATAAYAWRLSRYMRRSQVHIVHTNSLKAHLLGGLAARLAGRKLVWHLRDRIAEDYLPRPAVWLVKILSRIFPTFIIANSQATLNTIAPRNDRGFTLRTRVVHDGCTIPSNPSPVTNGPVKIGLIGRISPWKGQHVFIKAAAIIKNKFPDVRFRIIGSALFSETGYEAEVKQLVNDLDLADQVEFLGFIADIERASAELDIVVHASTLAEPFGQVVIEAMAASKPVIATRGGGVPEIVVDGETGLLVPMNDERAMAAAMEDLLGNPARAQEMGARGRQRVREFFTIQRTARAVEHVYRDLMRTEHAQIGSLEPMMPERVDP